MDGKLVAEAIPYKTFWEKIKYIKKAKLRYATSSFM